MHPCHCLGQSWLFDSLKLYSTPKNWCQWLVNSIFELFVFNSVGRHKACHYFYSINWIFYRLKLSKCGILFLLGGSYLYLESTYRKYGDVAVIRSEEFKPTTMDPKQMIFHYYMYGFTVNQLRVLLQVNSTRTQIWQQFGSQGPKWIKAVVNLTSAHPYRVISPCRDSNLHMCIYTKWVNKDNPCLKGYCSLYNNAIALVRISFNSEHFQIKAPPRIPRNRLKVTIKFSHFSTCNPFAICFRREWPISVG